MKAVTDSITCLVVLNTVIFLHAAILSLLCTIPEAKANTDWPADWRPRMSLNIDAFNGWVRHFILSKR